VIAEDLQSISDQETNSNESGERKKFIPKRRTPYLLQEEVIKSKELENLIKIGHSSSSAIDSNKESISSQYDHNDKRLLNDIKSVNHDKLKKIKKISNYASDIYKESISSQINSDINVHEEVSRLYGIQKKIIYYFTECCILRNQTKTGPVTADTLTNVTGSTKKTIKKVIQRLLEKGLLKRENGKRGKGGFAIFELQQDFINIDKLQKELEHNYLATASSKEIPSIKNPRMLPEEWKKIDFSSLNGVNFTETQLLQLYENNLNTPNIIQDSIHHFAFGLENNEKFKTYKDPLNVLMGVLRKGGSWVELNYESPKQKALRELIERKKSEKEKYDAMISSLTEIEFPSWKKSLSEENIQSIVPSDILKVNLAPAITASLRSYYVENVLLPRLRNEGIIEA